LIIAGTPLKKFRLVLPAREAKASRFVQEFI
jgi:hypothetical protein